MGELALGGRHCHIGGFGSLPGVLRAQGPYTQGTIVSHPGYWAKQEHGQDVWAGKNRAKGAWNED